jgi:uroporphyrinogen-III synthase
MSHLPLLGRRVVTTRHEPGQLDALLRAAGAEVVHVPLIEIVDADDDGRALDKALGSLVPSGWLIVTSVHGARRVGEAAAANPAVRLAAVGTRTARELSAIAGRAVDVVPSRQTAHDLVVAMPALESTETGIPVVIAQADRAASTLAEGLTAKGYSVDAVTAYATTLRQPTPTERLAAVAADAVAFASGSAAKAWAAAIGTVTPNVVVAIGPTTAAAATEAGLTVTHVASEHDVDGLFAEIVAALRCDS